MEILTAKRAGPAATGSTQTWATCEPRAPQKIRAWFKRQDREENIALGREMLERELKRLGYQGRLEQIAELFSYDTVDDFFAAIGYGDLNTQHVATHLVELEEPRDELVTEERPAGPASSDIHVLGVGKVLTSLARCCNPLPGDEIIGYITRGRGVTVHRRDCPNVLNSSDMERLIEVDWGKADGNTYPVTVQIRAWDRGGLLRDIAAVVADEDINLSAANVVTHKKENMATITATLEIRNMAQLSRILAKLEHLPNVLEARRLVG